MGTIYEMKKCPVFEEAGNINLTTPYGKNIKDYPTKGKSGDHFGVDITRYVDGKSTTATVTAIADGIITAQRKWVEGYTENPSFGNCVYIKHADGMVTKYAHLKHGMPDWIKDGSTVKKGDALGIMGSTGYSFGAHLHFQVEDENGNTVDPLQYLLGKKTIGEKETYQVVLSKEYEDKTEAEKTAQALNTLGIKSEIKKTV